MEKTNGAKLSRLLIDGGTTVLRERFDGFHPPTKLTSDLHFWYSTLNNLLRRRILNRHQWDKLFPPDGSAPDSQTFDITLLFLLLTNICGLSPPPSGWHTKPPASDTSLEANLARIKFFRNALYGHVSTTAVDPFKFSTLWQEITLPLIALGLDQAEIDRLKAESGGEGDYLDALFEWAGTEKDIKSQLREIAAGLHQVKEAVDSLKEGREKVSSDGILQNLARLDFKGDIKNYVQRFRADTREWAFNSVQNWLDDRSSPNRVMLIEGNAGMGKSVMAAVICQRMQDAGKLLGNHFCQHNNARYRNPQLMLQSLACHLSHTLPEYKQALGEHLSRNLGTDLNNMDVEELFALLFKEPLSTLSDPESNMLMVIDGLDESEYQGRNQLLDVIANQFCKLPSWFRFLVTTRPATNIKEKLKHLKPFQLEPEDEKNVQDIRIVLQQKLQHVIKAENREDVLENLVLKCEGLMLYAHFLILAIEENPSVLDKDLDDSLPLGISSVYSSYFKRLESELLKEDNIKEENFLNLLCAITASREPLPIDFVSRILLPGEDSPHRKRQILKALGIVSSLLPIRDGCLYVIHKSVKDWLTDSSCYGEHEYIMNEEQGHRKLASLCTAELDDLKRRGVRNVQYSATETYALNHGARHMFHEETRRDRLKELTNCYVTDLDLIYAKLCVSSSVAAEDIVWLQKKGISTVLPEDVQTGLKTLLIMLRKYHNRLRRHPYLLLQYVLNEGVTVLSGEAANLLQNKYPEIPYMEYLNKESQQRCLITRFPCSADVVCIDVSPNLEYMVCECKNGMLQLFSLQTGRLLWKRPVKVPKSLRVPVFSFYRSAVFHPSEDLVFPGILSHAYTTEGDVKPIFVESSCRFSQCSISGDKCKVLTNCEYDAKCLVMWSLKDGTEIARITRDEDILSFAWSQDGTLLAISHSMGSICLLDVKSDFTILAQTTLPEVCGMLKFSPKNQVVFCFAKNGIIKNCLFRVNVSLKGESGFSLDVSSGEVLYDPKEFDSLSDCGFLLGDPIPTSEGGLYFVLDKHTALTVPWVTGTIEMLSTEEEAKDSKGLVTQPKQIAVSSDGETVCIVSVDYPPTLVAWDVSSGKRIAEKNTGIARNTCLVAVTEGVLLEARDGYLELWKFDLSACIRRWTHLSGIRKVIPFSEERVAFVTEKDVIVLDTTSENIVLRIPAIHEVVGCNSKLQILTTDGPGSCQLAEGTSVVWEKKLPPDFSSVFTGAVFSLSEQFVIICQHFKVFILDAISGNTLHMFNALPASFVIFISDEECVVSEFSSVLVGRSSFRLYNVRSGDMLSVMDIEESLSCLAVCPSKRLFAIGLSVSDISYKVIRVWLPADKDSRKNRRMDNSLDNAQSKKREKEESTKWVDNTVETVERKKLKEQGDSKSGMDNTVDTVNTQQLKEQKKSKMCLLV